jgi:integrase
MSFEKQTRVYDTSLPGFGILVGKRTKTFFVVRGKERKLTVLGHYPDLTLKRARSLAGDEKASSPDPTQKTPQNAILSFLEASRLRTQRATTDQYASYLNQMHLTTLDLTYQDVQNLLKRWDGKPFAQNYAYATLRAFLNWCLDHEYIDRHPLIRKKAPNRTRSRDRVLSDEELARVWRCTDDDTYGRILRLLILTGQRREEVRGIKPEDVQDGTITFHVKGGKTNILPLTPLIEEQLVSIPFTFNNWSTAKARFDTDCGVDFRHHDLRRSLSTKMAMLGVPVTTIERILGHSIGGIAGIYNRYSYIPEMKEALLLYEGHIRKITTA